MKRNKPVRLHKQPEKRPLIEKNMIDGIPIEFILIAVILTCIFCLTIAFMGPCTESGLWFNMQHA